MQETEFAPDLSDYRLANNQTEVMLSKHVKILNEHDRQVKVEGSPHQIRKMFLTAMGTNDGTDYELFYKRLYNLILLKKVYIK
jgi:hypothetical protein